MLQCNLTKSDESSFFVLNVGWVFARNWVLPYVRPLHILHEKKAILLKRIASKKGYSARDYAPKVLLCSNYASVKIDIPGFKILKHDK